MRACVVLRKAEEVLVAGWLSASLEEQQIRYSGTWHNAPGDSDRSQVGVSKPCPSVLVVTQPSILCLVFLRGKEHMRKASLSAKKAIF